MSKSIIAEVKIIPIGTATTSLSRYVAACINIAKQATDIDCQITAMGTILQGPLERVLELAQKMHDATFAMGAQRVVTTISIDDRRDKVATMESKVQAVTQPN